MGTPHLFLGMYHFVNQLSVLWILVGQGVRGELEIGEVEAGGYSAASQGVCAAGSNAGAKPGTSFDNGKGERIGLRAEEVGVQNAIGCDLENMEGVSGIMMPEFIGGDAVEGRKFAIFQQKVNAGHSRAGAVM
jgi:hypothetical protein